MATAQRRRQEGLCIRCGGEAAPSMRKNSGAVSQFCLKHLQAHREYQRIKLGRVRRNKAAASYLLSRKAAEKEK